MNIILSQAAKFNLVFVYIFLLKDSFTNKTHFPGALQTRVHEGFLL